ncbi:hypothetical protein CEXT_220751 [Caerostris extrusa]|uniref:Uncharacterized protein n=1 Tax=Caerostris extrusa TaxID=172846 RepID=A0AAV4TGQ8_CAEEX|nr:hypothetical protein CEXT_220751 [Caerostris extrusa]
MTVERQTKPLITSGMHKGISTNSALKWTFQQDNASVYISCSTKSWMKVNEMKLLQWPSGIESKNLMESRPESNGEPLVPQRYSGTRCLQVWAIIQYKA